MMKPSLKNRALRYLSMREHSRLELLRKLSPFAESSEELEKLLDQLTEQGWLSQERFVASLIRKRAQRFGQSRIRQELQLHGLSRSQIDQSLLEQAYSEKAAIAQIWQRRFSAPATTPQEKAKQMRYLMAKGFTLDSITAFLKQTQAKE